MTDVEAGVFFPTFFISFQIWKCVFEHFLLRLFARCCTLEKNVLSEYCTADLMSDKMCLLQDLGEFSYRLLLFSSAEIPFPCPHVPPSPLRTHFSQLIRAVDVQLRYTQNSVAMLASSLTLAALPPLLLNLDTHRLRLSPQHCSTALKYPLVDMRRSLHGVVAATEHTGAVQSQHVSWQHARHAKR